MSAPSAGALNPEQHTHAFFVFALSVSSIFAISTGTRFDLTPEKKAANSWNCWRFQGSLGWSWHWALDLDAEEHPETSPAISTGG